MDLAALEAAAVGTLAAASIRAFPVLGCALATRRIALSRKLLVGLVGLLAVIGLYLGHVLPLGWVALAYAYFAAMAFGALHLVRLVRAGTVAPSGVFAASAVAFFLLPALFWPAPAKAAALVLGWELVLAGHSFVVEAAKSREDVPLGDAMFFLLVNPALVYTRRGERCGPPRLDGRGAARAAGALLLAFAVSALVAPWIDRLHAAAFPAAGTPASLAGMAAYGAARFFVEYGRQSATAGLQIGLILQLGYRVPERFDWPLLATSPPDFWRRWNTYVGHWMLRYVFWPVSIGLGRAGHALGKTAARAARVAAPAAGILAAFAAVGVLHDAFVYGNVFVLETHMLQAFLANGVLVVAWVGGERALEAARGRFALFARAGSVLSRALMWVTAAGCFAVWWS